MVLLKQETMNGNKKKKIDTTPHRTKQQQQQQHHHQTNNVTANFFYYYLPLRDIEIYTNGIQGDGVLRRVCFLTIAAMIYTFILILSVFFPGVPFPYFGRWRRRRHSFMRDHKISGDVDATADGIKKRKETQNEIVKSYIESDDSEKMRRKIRGHLNATTALMFHKFADANSSIVFDTRNYICASRKKQ